jgi:predicted Zn-dependent peptidase
MPFHTHTLPNGLQIIGETSPAMRSVSIGFFTRTGARDETPEVSGVSHFLEHMMFKGTPRRTALDVNLDFDRIGSEPNAYTSEENTGYHVSFLPEHLPMAVDILADILRPSLRDDDFDTEKNVILEEIGMYDDMPAYAAMDHSRRIYYGPHPLGNSVLGSTQSVSALTRDQMREYFARRYSSSNMVFAAAGNFDFDELVALVGKACGHWEPTAVGRENRTPWAGVGGLHVLTRAKVQQEHLLMYAAGPPADSPMRYAADTLALALGDDGSRLYWALEDPGLAESADCSFYENDGCGTVCVSVSGEPENAAGNLEIARRILAEVQAGGITADELQTAKNKIASRIVRSGERPMGRMRAIVGAWMYTNEYRDVDTELAAYDAVTLADIRAYLDAYPVTAMTVIAFGPAAEVAGVTGTAV